MRELTLKLTPAERKMLRSLLQAWALLAPFMNASGMQIATRLVDKLELDEQS